jgi:hypothetical protein
LFLVRRTVGLVMASEDFAIKMLIQILFVRLVSWVLAG